MSEVTETGIVANEGDNSVFATGEVWSSTKPRTREDALDLYDKLSDSDLIENHIGELLMVSDIVLQKVEVESKKTGEMVEATRAVIITSEGEAFACTSQGIEVSLKNLFMLMGQPTWEPPLPMIPIKKQGNNGYKFTTLRRAKPEEIRAGGVIKESKE